MGYVFDGDPNTCEDAMDANDDGAVDQTDAIHVWTYVLNGGPPPAAPFPDCGSDTTQDSLDCDQHLACQ